MAFIDAQRVQGHAVESICRVLSEQGCQVAARTYRAWKQGRPVAARTHTDAIIMDAIIATVGTPEALYRRRKMTAWLRPQGHQLSYDTTDRLMKALGRNGARRGKAVRTTVPRKDGHRAGDLLNRDFTAPAPNRVWVTDFTYCRTWAGFVYVAFIVDVFAQRIVAWHAATDKRTDLVLAPLRMALWDRDRQGHPVVPGELVSHSDAGSQGGFHRSSQHLDGGGGWDGTTGWVVDEDDWAPVGAVAGPAGFGTPGGPGILLGRGGARCRDRGRRGSGRRVPGGGHQVVSPVWRDAERALRAGFRPVPVLR
jgi:putative transposase